jgi:hypothetical protein
LSGGTFCYKKTITSINFTGFAPHPYFIYFLLFIKISILVMTSNK